MLPDVSCLKCSTKIGEMSISSNLATPAIHSHYTPARVPTGRYCWPFGKYQTRSPVGYENMSWKDSGDSVVYPDGSLVKGPKALCGLQGYVYSAWIRMAELFDALGKCDRAGELRAKAAALFERFNATFWDDELGFYAYEPDVASDAGGIETLASRPFRRTAQVTTGAGITTRSLEIRRRSRLSRGRSIKRCGLRLTGSR